MHKRVALFRDRRVVKRDSLIDDELSHIFGKLYSNPASRPFKPEFGCLPRLCLLHPELGGIIEGCELHSDGVISTAAALPEAINRNCKEFRSRQFRSTADGIVADRLELLVASDRIEASCKIRLGRNQWLAAPLTVGVKREG